MREIKKIGPEWVEPYLDIYCSAYPAHFFGGASSREAQRVKVLTDMERDRDEVEFVGLLEDGVLAAIMKVVSFSMNFYGGMGRAAGLMSLAVHPLYKRRGLSLEMVRHFETRARESGALAALLLPFSIPFYRRMGYGLGTVMDEYRIAVTALPAAAGGGDLCLLGAGDLEEMLACHRRCVRQNHGMLDKTGEEIRAMERDPSPCQIGCRGKDGQLLGYLCFRYAPVNPSNYLSNRICVEELVYQSGAVLRQLLGFLRSQAAQAREVIIRSGEADFCHLLEDPQSLSGDGMPFGYLETSRRAHGTMYKLPDPARLVAATGYRRFPPYEGTVCFCYEDALSREERAVRIAFRRESAGCSRWYAAPPDSAAAVTIRCSQGDLASLLLGAAGLAALVRLGCASLEGEGDLAALDRLFSAEQRPFTNTDY